MQTSAHPPVPCPACGAVAGAPCRESRMPIGLDPYETPRPLFARPPHLKRLELAARVAAMLLVGQSLGLRPLVSLQSIAIVNPPPL